MIDPLFQQYLVANGKIKDSEKDTIIRSGQPTKEKLNQMFNEEIEKLVTSGPHAEVCDACKWQESLRAQAH